MSDAARRIARARNEPLYLVDERAGTDRAEYDVMGTRGTVYTVTVGRAGVTCTCPDYLHRRARCKHGYFVVDRVLQYPDPDGLPERLASGFVPKRLPTAGESCAICLDDFAGDEPESGLARCARTCGRAVHAECFSRWSAARNSRSCVYCRSPM